MAVLKFFDVVLKFELPTARFLNFPKNSAAVLIRPVLIIGDCVYWKCVSRHICSLICVFHAPGDDGFFFHTSEDDVFGDDLLPFTEIAMKGQDKNEDIMEALSIDVNKKPYFPYLGFYITLAIIKKNNFEASKVDEQFL